MEERTFALHSWSSTALPSATRYMSGTSTRRPTRPSSRSSSTGSPTARRLSPSTTLARTPGRGVIGSQHKRAGLNGAEYAFTPTQRQGRGGHSVAEIEVTKDRHGYVREFAPDGRIGRLHVSDGKVEIVPPDPDKAGPGGDVRLRVAILKWIEAHPGGSGREVAKGVQRGDKTVNAELRLL